MKWELLVPGFIGLAAVSIFSLLMNITLTNAIVICVDKYNETSVIPCSDQNAVDKNGLKTTMLPVENIVM